MAEAKRDLGLDADQPELHAPGYEFGLGRIIRAKIGAQKAAVVAEAAPTFHPPIASPSRRATGSWI